MHEPLNILIIEDDLPTINRIQGCLKDVFGDTIHLLVSQSIKQAAQILISHTISAILLDLKLPDSNGYESIKRVKNLTSVPIVVLTGLQDENARARSIAFGVDLINKDDMSELVQRIINAIEFSKRKRSEESLITTRLDAMLTVIESLNQKLEQIPIISERVDKIHLEIYGDEGLQKTLRSYRDKVKSVSKITWGTLGLAGGGAITALVTWIVNKTLG